MKLLKCLSAVLLGATFVSTASAAPTIIHVVGSTAFRTGTTIAIVDMLAGTTVANNGGTGYEYTVSPGSTTVYGAASTTNMSSAGQAIFANGTIGTSGTATIIVETYWTGSLAGVVDLVSQTSDATFYDETNTSVISAVNAQAIPTTGSTAYASPATALTTTGTTKAATGDTIEMAMSDSVKTTIDKELATGSFTSGTTSIGSYSSIGALATACGGNTIADAGTVAPGTVAIVPFQWAVNNISGVPAYGDNTTVTIPTNITQQVARQLITSGSVSQALFTGGSTDADFGNWFMFLGRNEDSGTRIGYLAESQFGVVGNPVQWSPTTSIAGANSTTAETTLYPITPLNTEPHIVWNTVGHSGFASGGNISGPLAAADNGSINMDPNYTPSSDYVNGFFISSLGITDAYAATSTTVGSGAHNLTYNGVAYSPANVQNGSYSMWEYEHCYRLTNAVTAIKNAVNTIADIITASDADVVYGSTSNGYVTHSENETTGTYTAGPTVNGVPQWPVGVKNDEFMQVSRSATEGGPIGTNY